ncbi:MAG: hypothetical protein HC904_01115 [Blastochloris sp.]|nr:hypothetical protein [Blastochloris sp.]
MANLLIYVYWMRSSRFHFLPFWKILLCSVLFYPIFCPAETTTNLLRNGSFEGSLLYWNGQNKKEVVEGGKFGKYAFKMTGDWSLSAPIPMERDAVYTITLWAKLATEGNNVLQFGMRPMAREHEVRPTRLSEPPPKGGFPLTTEWQRFSATFKADCPRHGMWPLPHYGISLDSNDDRTPILIDGVTVTKGDQPAATYLPRSPIEVTILPTNLPGYRGAAGNMYKKGATATLDALLHNPGDQAREVLARWQLMDYEGSVPLAEPVDTKIKIAPGATIKVPATLPLSANGTVLARCSILDSSGKVLDSSHIPLTSLPYEKAATQPNYEERFGGSFAGGVECLDRMQRIGFGWTRWWANNKWHDYEPEEGKFDWSMDKQQQAWDRGISNHIVLYGWPKWIMDQDHPLPRDMRWPAEDPRWEDLSVVTAWDRFVKAAVENFRGKSVVFQIANEPGHDQWKKGWIKEYVKFNQRTARLIKQTDPKARVSVNNVYLNPSPDNAALLGAKDFKNFDVWSWHDYHAGWLGDAVTMKRMHSMLAEAGGKHLEVWFTEGWAFTNTLVDQPIACTSLTSVESTHAIMNSVAELTANGHDKMVLFHLMYGTHGMSFWDYSGPGVMLWDWYDYPTALVGAWNVINHHIGLSRQVGFVRPPGANFCIFTDLRNNRGVMIAFADRNAKNDVVIDLPLSGLTAEDLQANPVQMDGTKLTLKASGRPVILYTATGGKGEDLLPKLEPLDRKHLGFVSAGEGQTKIYRLPDVWDGVEKKSSKGNPVLNGDQPIWRVDRLYPNDPIMPANYSPMVWGNQRWEAPDYSQGGHPSVTLKDGLVSMGTLGPWNGKDTNFKKQPALVFIVPESGVYQIQFTAHSDPWGGTKADAFLYLMKRDEQRVGELKKITLKADQTPIKFELELDAASGHEIVILSEMPNHNGSTNVILKDLSITKK